MPFRCTRMHFGLLSDAYDQIGNTNCYWNCVREEGFMIFNLLRSLLYVNNVFVRICFLSYYMFFLSFFIAISFFPLLLVLFDEVTASFEFEYKWNVRNHSTLMSNMKQLSAEADPIKSCSQNIFSLFDAYIQLHTFSKVWYLLLQILADRRHSKDVCSGTTLPTFIIIVLRTKR